MPSVAVGRMEWRVRDNGWTKASWIYKERVKLGFEACVMEWLVPVLGRCSWLVFALKGSHIWALCWERTKKVDKQTVLPFLFHGDQAAACAALWNKRATPSRNPAFVCLAWQLSTWDPTRVANLDLTGRAAVLSIAGRSATDEASPV